MRGLVAISPGAHQAPLSRSVLLVGEPGRLRVGLRLLGLELGLDLREHQVERHDVEGPAQRPDDTGVHPALRQPRLHRQGGDVGHGQAHAVEVVGRERLGSVEHDEPAVLEPAGHVGLGQQQMVEHHHDVRGLDGGDVVDLLLGYLERGEDRSAATFGAEGGGHDHSGVSGLERRRSEYLRRGDGALSASAVPTYLDHSLFPTVSYRACRVFY